MSNSCILWFRWALFAEFIVNKLKMYEHHPENPKCKTVEKVAASKSAAAKISKAEAAAKVNIKEDPLSKFDPLPRFLRHLIVQTWKYLSRGTPERNHIFLSLMVCHAVRHAMLDEAKKGPTGVPEDDHTIFDALFPVSKVEYGKLVGCFGLRSAVELIQATADVLENRIFRARANLPSVPDAHIHVLASAGPFLIGNQAAPLNLQEAVRAAQRDPLQSGVPVDAVKLHPWMTIHTWRALTNFSRDIARFKGIELYFLEARSVPIWAELVDAADAHVLVIMLYFVAYSQVVGVHSTHLHPRLSKPPPFLSVNLSPPSPR